VITPSSINGIVNHHCLNFFFIIKQIFTPPLPKVKKSYKIQNLTKCRSLNYYRKEMFRPVME